MSIITDLRDALLTRFAANSAPTGGYGSPAVWNVASSGQRILANSLAEAIAPALGGAGNSTASQLAVYTTAQRLALSATMGMIFFDSDLLQICVYVGNSWMAIPYAGMISPNVLINGVPTNGLMPPQSINAVPTCAATVTLT